MGIRKQRWTAEEEEALKAGVAKYGAGKWKIILVDSEFSSIFSERSNVDLKDKWRNMVVNHGQGYTDNSTAHEAKASVASAVSLEIQNNPPVLGSKKNVLNYAAMIHNALSSLKDPMGSDISAIVCFIEQNYEVPQSFRKQVSSKLRRLVLQGKLEKVQQCYRIKDDVALCTKTPSPKQKDVRPKPSLVVSAESDTVKDAANTAVKWIADAENKAFLTSEALKESELTSRMAEDADAMFTLAEELYEKCYGGARIFV